MPYRPRFLNRVWAWLRGYFWVPCPICKKSFGEHEWLPGNELWLTDRDAVAVCPSCHAAAAEQNRANGWPANHPPDGDTYPPIR